MMENAILAKLRDKLARLPEGEADIVYILVEIRKYLEHTDPKSSKYLVLRTYCEWPLHIILDRKGAKTLLLKLDETFTAPVAERDRARKAIFDEFSLNELRSELGSFLKSKRLPDGIVNNASWWGQFLKHYINVVSDCPFVYEGKGARTKTIKRATLQINELTKALENEVEGMVNVVWNWEVELTDGTKKTFSNTYGFQAMMIGGSER